MKDLTKGSPLKLIILFALPILLGNIFQQAYNFTDIMIIGRCLGKDSLAAVGSTASVVSLMFNIINGLVTGFAIIAARNFGADDMEELRKTIARMTVFSGITTAVIIAGILCFVNPLLKALDTPESIIGEARLYLSIVAAGLAVTLFYNLEACILRAVGDSFIPLIILAISSLLNISLDLLMIGVFKMGVAGAALATVAAQFISAVLCLIYLIKKRPFLMVGKKDFVFDRHSSAELLGSGFGMALMYSIVDIGSIVLQNGVNGFGEDIIAAHTAARKIFSFSTIPFSAVSATMVTFSGQNLGAGKFNRIRKGIRDGLIIDFSWATIALGAVFLAGESLVRLILPEGSDNIIGTAALYLKVNVPFFYFLAVLLGLRSSLQGLGKSVIPIIASIIELIWKVCTVIFMIPAFGYFGIIISEPIVWTVCAFMIGIITIFTFRSLPTEDMSDT